MTRHRLPALILGLSLAFASQPIRAHHSETAEYDTSKPVKVTGTLKRVEWQNPHVWFYVDVKDEAGKVSNWGFEMGSPNGLMRAGWTRNTMKVGDMVTVEGSLAKDGSLAQIFIDRELFKDSHFGLRQIKRHGLLVARHVPSV